MDVVIVTYNSKGVIERSVEAVLDLPMTEQLVVVEHGTDGSDVRARQMGAHVVSSAKNRGFGAGQNEGSRHGTDPYLLLLNPDAEPDADGIAAGVLFLDNHPDVAAVQGVIVNRRTGLPERSQGIELGALHLLGRAFHVRSFVGWRLVRAFARRNASLRDHVLRIPDAPTDVESLAATALLMRRAAFDVVGGFDERFFLYGEDLDLCRRLRFAGWRLVAMPDRWALHTSGESSHSSFEREWAWWRGTVQFAAYWWRRPAWSVAVMAAAVQDLKFGATRLLHRRRHRPHRQSVLRWGLQQRRSARKGGSTWVLAGASGKGKGGTQGASKPICSALEGDSPRPKLTVLSPFVPDQFATHAGGQYLASYCVEASWYADVTVVAPVPSQRSASLVPPTDFTLELVDVKASRLFGLAPLARVRNALAGLTPGPGVVKAFGSNPKVQRLVREADIVEVHFTHFLPVAANLLTSRAPKVVSAFAYDVFTQSVGRQATASEGVAWRAGARIATAITKRKEPRLLNRSDLVCVFSAKDESLLRGLNVAVPVHILSPDIELPAIAAEHDGPPVVLFGGAMFRRVNYRAIEEFLRTGWPNVRAAVPDARFVVVGAEPPPHLASDPRAGVEITGFVEDLNAAYRSASCFVAPLTAGAGVKFKVVRAMACGLPVVGTSVAFEGLPGAPGVVVNSSVEAADHLVDLLNDRQRRLALGAAGRTYVSSTFDFARSVAHLHDRYCQLISAAVADAADGATAVGARGT